MTTVSSIKFLFPRPFRVLGVTLAIVASLSLVLVQPAAAQEPAAAQDPAQAAKTFLPFIADDACFLVVRSEPTQFGVQVYGAAQRLAPYQCALVESGATWLRTEVSWKSAEPENTEPENFRWASTDQVLEFAKGTHLNVVAIVQTNPEWAATGLNGVIDKTSYAEFAEYMGALAERYDGDGVQDAPGSPRVLNWEIYNEPDRAAGPGEVRWGENGEKYAQMLAAIYPAVKAASPDARVVFGGIAYDWFVDQGGRFVRSFLDDVLKAGGGRYFDVLAFHAYPPFAANWGAPNGPGLLEKAVVVRAKMKEYGIEAKPILISEAGMHSNDNPGSPMTPELQARYVAQLYAQATAAKAEAMIWFMLYDPPAYYPYKNGLVTNADTGAIPQAKPAYDAYQVAVQHLRHAQIAAVLTKDDTGNEDIQAYRFERDVAPATLYVAWFGKIDGTGTAVLRLPGTRATVSNIYGNAVEVTDGTDGRVDGKISVTVGAQPVYVEMP